MCIFARGTVSWKFSMWSTRPAGPTENSPILRGGKLSKTTTLFTAYALLFSLACFVIFTWADFPNSLPNLSKELRLLAAMLPLVTL